MKHLAFLAAILASYELFAQCNPSIPSNAMVMNTTQTIGFGGAQLWVCPGDTITSNGGSHTVYLESTAVFQAGGGSNTIYCPPGAKVNVTSGSNIIYYVNAADLISTGGGPTLNQCPSITYNYSSAPVPGCQQTTGIAGSGGMQLQVFPNPATGIVNIRSTNHPVSGLTVLDPQGRTVYAATLTGDENAVDISMLEGGHYILRILAAGGEVYYSAMVLIK